MSNNLKRFLKSWFTKFLFVFGLLGIFSDLKLVKLVLISPLISFLVAAGQALYSIIYDIKTPSDFFSDGVDDRL